MVGKLGESFLMNLSRQIEFEELDALATGAWILGAGGGGNPYQALLGIRQLYGMGHRAILLDPTGLDDEDLVAVVSNMGAPLVGQERLTDPALAVKPVRMMEEYMGRHFRAVMSLEIGGGNAIQPLLVAALMDIPVVDADTMGRAYPEAQMTSFAIADLPMFPLTLGDVRDNEVIVSRAASWKWMERISRKVCTEVGSIAATCKAPRTGQEVREFGILYSVTKAIHIGKAVHQARAEHGDPIRALLDVTGGKSLFEGKAVDVDRQTTEGFLRGTATFDGIGKYSSRQLSLDFQNEFAVASIDNLPEVTVPELICVMDSESGEAVGTETLRYGQRVVVVVLPAPPIQMTKKGLEHVGPRAFGYDLDFHSYFDK